MAKRFYDTEIWQKEWYQELTIKEKILVNYLICNCDCAGMWHTNFRLASFIIGETVALDDIKSINEKNEMFEILEDGKIFVFDFVKFQYGQLSESCKPHKPVIEKLKKYGLYERVSKGYPYPLDTLEEKEKDKEKEQEKEKGKETKIENFKNHDLMFDKNVEKVIAEYAEKCKNCLPIKFERRDLELRGEIDAFLTLIEYNFDYVSELCKKANDLKSIYENPIDLKAMIKNHARIFSGFYNGAKENNTSKASDAKPVTSVEDVAKAMRGY